jgi:hypothetical protein
VGLGLWLRSLGFRRRELCLLLDLDEASPFGAAEAGLALVLLAALGTLAYTTHENRLA